LDEGRGHDNRDGIALHLAVRFEQQRYIEDYHLRSVTGRTAEKVRFFLADKRMEKGFEAPQALFVTEDASGQRLAIDGAIAGNAAK
jgi:hypothetical protein